MIVLDISPMSQNKARKGKHFKTPEYKQYEQDCLLLLIPNNERYRGWVEVKYKFYIKNYKKADLGNFEKCLSDILCKAGILEDDRYIKKIIMEKFMVKTKREERIEILIKKVID